MKVQEELITLTRGSQSEFPAGEQTVNSKQSCVALFWRYYLQADKNTVNLP
jgi:hypothetical protein